MNTKGKTQKRSLWKDTKAVSPVVAVLILIIVAVIGGVAVGLLQTGIQEKAEGQAEFGDIGTHSLKIIGGPGVSMMMAGPVEAAGSVKSDDAPEGTLLHEFAAKNPKIKVEFLRECCGFAMYALPVEACDMGIGRRFPTNPEKAAYPELQFKVVGKAPIAVIAKEGGDFIGDADNPYQTNHTVLKDIFIERKPVTIEETERKTKDFEAKAGVNVTVLGNDPNFVVGSENIWNVSAGTNWTSADYTLYYNSSSGEVNITLAPGKSELNG